MHYMTSYWQINNFLVLVLVVLVLNIISTDDHQKNCSFYAMLQVIR